MSFFTIFGDLAALGTAFNDLFANRGRQELGEVHHSRSTPAEVAEHIRQLKRAALQEVPRDFSRSLSQHITDNHYATYTLLNCLDAWLAEPGAGKLQETLGLLGVDRNTLIEQAATIGKIQILQSTINRFYSKNSSKLRWRERSDRPVSKEVFDEAAQIAGKWASTANAVVTRKIAGEFGPIWAAIAGQPTRIEKELRPVIVGEIAKLQAGLRSSQPLRAAELAPPPGPAMRNRL